MKKTILFSLAICIIIVTPSNSQGGLLKKVSKSVTNDLLGKPKEGSENKKTDQPEPTCACDKPIVAMDMGGKLQLDYSELTISISDDGRILAQHRGTKDYYVVKDGVTQGPYKSGDPKLSGFENIETKDNADAGKETDVWANNEYISKSGEKHLIKFGGKSYGPYGQIKQFTVTKSKDKFAAIVVESIPVSAAESKKMDDAIKNAKTDQEKMDLSMQYTQEMLQKMQQDGGPKSLIPKLVTNIAGSNYDEMKSGGGTLNGKIKYDDILVVTFDKIFDLQGKVVLNLKQDAIGAKDLFVNTTNTKYAFYNFGTLTFSDNTTMSELFNLHLIKENAQVYLAYMYYSPKRNAIMQCKIPF